MIEQANIFALSSGTLPSGVAVVRMSGPDVLAVACRMTGGVVPLRTASLRPIQSLTSGDLIDTGLVLAFQGPASFTGEDVIEFHVHGSKAVVSAIFDDLRALPEFSPAEAGAFSRRAFENGKMDLTALEGLSDLLAAETEQQRKMAVAQAGGALRETYDTWRHQLLEARAFIEAELDFSDEEGVPGSVADQVWPVVASLESTLRNHLRAAGEGSIIRDGYKVVLTGPPNSGKSTLFNNLAKRDVAIVTDTAGTTRDVLEVQLDIDGHYVRLFDTAGIRDTENSVEKLGIARAEDAIEEADLVLHLSGDNGQPAVDMPGWVNLRTFADLDAPEFDGDDELSMDARTSAAADCVLDVIRERLNEATPSSVHALANRERHKSRLQQALSAVADSRKPELPLEVRAEFLRNATDNLAALTGRIDTEELLGAIFSEFCVGK